MRRNKQVDQYRGGTNPTYRKYFGRHEHRVLMEKMLGRALKKGEIVHHRDGNPRNNNLDNLVLMENQGVHINEHRPEMVAARLRADAIRKIQKANATPAKEA